jgi:hypothetical protein
MIFYSIKKIILMVKNLDSIIVANIARVQNLIRHHLSRKKQQMGREVFSGIS